MSQNRGKCHSDAVSLNYGTHHFERSGLNSTRYIEGPASCTYTDGAAASAPSFITVMRAWRTPRQTLHLDGPRWSTLDDTHASML